MRAVANQTQYGFKYGPVEVTRIYSDEKGGVWLELKTKRSAMMVRVTPTGLIRVDE